MRLGSKLSALTVAAAIFSTAALVPSYAAPLTIDRDHSNVGFSVRHLFTRVQGRFRDFSGTVVFDENNPSASSVNATIQTASVDTNVEARDKDLRSARFFDADTFPTLTFKSSSVEKIAKERFKIDGTLTMHGVSKEVTLDAEFLGKGKDPWDNLRYGFRAVVTVNRKDFGMQWNEVLESGGLLVGDEVEITLDIEAVPAE